MKLPAISLCRRFTQLVSFALLVYSGFILAGAALSIGDGVEFESPAGSELRDNVLFTEGEPSLLDVFPPAAPCFFVEGRKFVKGCNIYLLSDALARHTRLSVILPAVLVFVLLSFLLGRWWCGWVCPLGALGDVLDAVRRWLRVHHARWSAGVKRGLRASSYATFFATAGISFLIGIKPFRWLQRYLYLPFCEICPARLACPVLAGASPSFAGSFATVPHCLFTLLMYGVLAFFVSGFLSARRIWCHFCPIGLATSWFNRGAALELGKDDLRCNRCGACAEACPMDCDHLIEKSRFSSKATSTREFHRHQDAGREGKELRNHHNCIFCLRCVEQCPKEKCLSLRFFGLRFVESRLRPIGGVGGRSIDNN